MRLVVDVFEHCGNEIHLHSLLLSKSDKPASTNNVTAMATSEQQNPAVNAAKEHAGHKCQ
jgi:hypothetical protein